ncbi:S-adenosyl-L-methionine-dependent methyltransferase [Daedalea quercina L-15889]|uniref:S-adenosyl-L-methionine-dependent methyltransferase n=1 Tax=Daedalea quercina L-15889 TaxID=1314783 RepID=A0A165U0K6_9APHY|nr:S-adenosyl-L-methionine-dependent methyltransferase [Daedalea quercina L-15889]
MRLLCSASIYEEVEALRFKNNLSEVLARNPGAVAFQCLFGSKLFVEASEYLPAALLDPEVAGSLSATNTALQKSQGKQKTLWDIIEEGEQSDPTVAEIRKMFPLSMIGQGEMGSPALVADFPWGSLGEATIVDVGGGVGSMCLDLAKAFPDLRFVVEDLPVTIEQAKSVWDAEDPSITQAQRVQLLAHDFFTEQPAKGADVYFLRCILHDWPDDACVTILRKLRDAMGPESRVLIADMIVHPPLGSRHLRSAPAPLPANYGRANLFTGMRDMVMLAMFNGSERTPEQIDAIANRAGLKIEKIWECRGPYSITELRPTCIVSKL